jgi:phenol 2-monooxygenase
MSWTRKALVWQNSSLPLRKAIYLPVVQVSFRHTTDLTEITNHEPAVDYGKSLIVVKEGDAAEQGDGSDVATKDKSLQISSNKSLASKLNIGMRIPSFKVLNQADARPWHFQELLKSNGTWRVVVFAGNLGSPGQVEKLATIGKALGAPDSFVRRFSPKASKTELVFEILAVHSGRRQQTTIFDFPEIFRNFDERDGWDYSKILVDDQSYHEGHGHIYDNYGIDPEEGCVVILRPDQYISYIGPIDEYEALDKFFSGFMITQAHVEAEQKPSASGGIASHPKAEGSQ